MSEKPRLAALVDGAPLPDDAARELWTEFSAYMDEHRGDMAGFAKKKGWHAVAPEYRSGQAVLLVSTTAEAAKKIAPPPKPAKPKARPKPKAKRGPGPKSAAPKGKGGAKPRR